MDILEPMNISVRYFHIVNKMPANKKEPCVGYFNSPSLSTFKGGFRPGIII